MKTWIDNELARCKFKDVRLGKRFKNILERLSSGIGKTIPLACQDWASTKAAYRFLSNNRVDESAILGSHFMATRDRVTATDGPILVLQDTTEFSYQRNKPHLIGKTHLIHSHPRKDGRPVIRTKCGMLMHSSLVVTTEGLPLGLAAVKFWTRKKFKGCDALKKKINPTRVPIGQKESIKWLENLRQSTMLINEPERCIHIGDRESDIYELFCAACELNTHFLVRTCVDRLAGDGTRTVTEEMRETKVKWLHRIKVRDKKGKITDAALEIKCCRIRVLPPIGKQKNYPAQTLTILYAQERFKPKNRDKIDWKLITDLEVKSRQDAIEKINWYAKRWQIETFHKILKSGCKAEESKLRNADRLVNLISVFCIISWRIFWMTMINRSAENVPPKAALTKNEMQVLDQVFKDKPKSTPQKKSLSAYLTKIARLGGYLARSHDPPPGNIIMWRGLTRLIDIELGFLIGAKLVGN